MGSSQIYIDISIIIILLLYSGCWEASHLAFLRRSLGMRIPMAHNLSLHISKPILSAKSGPGYTARHQLSPTAPSRTTGSQMLTFPHSF